MDSIDLNRLSEISIKGRVAFSLCCLNNSIKYFHLEDSNWDLLMDKLWNYTSTDDLHIWYMEMAEYIPNVLLEYDSYVPEDFEYLSVDAFNVLKKLYKELNDDVREIIDCVFYVGTFDLYGQPQRRGRAFEYLKQLISVMEKNGIAIPGITQFEKYKFNYAVWDGWGNSFPRSEIVC